jgi:hypothetical protein
VLAASIIRAVIAVMMEAASASETSLNFYQNTRRNNPEDSHLVSLLLKPLLDSFSQNFIHLTGFLTYASRYRPAV